MTASSRLPSGGRIDRAAPISFRFDGKRYRGFAGDTLASALLANGVGLVGRSFKYHRPRGVYSAGVEEPSALVTLRDGARREPNIPATTVELYEGLAAESQNRWPSLAFDAMAVNGLFSPFFSAGFYYKTFMGPTRKSWMFFEPFIRRAAGLGTATKEPDPDHYEKAHAFCDVLVVGAGPAGIAAALAAGQAGRRVLLVEQQAEPGGALLSNPAAAPWLAEALGQLAGLANVRVMARTTAFGYYDGNTLGLVQRVSDHLAVPAKHQPRQRYWIARARQVVLATGAIERPLAFANNDLPGIMLASAARSYVNRYGVLPGRNAVVFTNNDSAYQAALDLKAAGARVALVDSRAEHPAALRAEAEGQGIELLAGHAVASAGNGTRLKYVDLAPLGADGTAGAAQRRPCDLLGVSGGWQPTVHLHSQSRVPLTFDEALAAFMPGALRPGQHSAGACHGAFALADCIAAGAAAGSAAAEAAGGTVPVPNLPSLPPEAEEAGIGDLMPLWRVPKASGAKAGKAFLDLQNDVSTGDIDLAHQEGYVSVEHMKRYTTLGMATDQGKTSNVNALAIMAERRQAMIPEVGTTTFRPPYTGVACGTLVGTAVDDHIHPLRLSPMQDWHRENGAVDVQAGPWIRPWYYPKPGEELDAAYRRETAAVRETVGIVDVSSLGKIDVQGPDAAEFLNRVYVNGWKALPVGKARYGIMLREDGIVMDDGTTSRIAEYHYFMTTTTANAGRVMAHLEFLLQTAWPGLKVQVTSVTDQWAGMAVAGPNSRALLADAVSDIDLGNEALPFMGVAEGHVGDIPVRIFRISFSGELAYEVFTPAGYGTALWERLCEAGKNHGLVLYGLEALGALRVEKGHVAGPELDGRTTLGDLGLGRMASTKKPFIGSVLMHREGLTREDRPTLVGLIPEDSSARLRAGAILHESGKTPQGHGLGHVTSVTYSPALGHYVALGLLAGGMKREGEVVQAVYAVKDQTVAVRVASPHFFDPEGERVYA